jgi:hypothetical protein
VIGSALVTFEVNSFDRREIIPAALSVPPFAAKMALSVHVNTQAHEYSLYSEPDGSTERSEGSFFDHSAQQFMLEVADVNHLLAAARHRWLTNQEIFGLLHTHHTCDYLRESRVIPDKPRSGTLLLYNRKHVNRFRQDGHNWLKKPDGKTLRESHEKLRISGKCVLNCCYSRSQTMPEFQRRLCSATWQQGNVLSSKF